MNLPTFVCVAKLQIIHESQPLFINYFFKSFNLQKKSNAELLRRKVKFSIVLASLRLKISFLLSDKLPAVLDIQATAIRGAYLATVDVIDGF